MKEQIINFETAKLAKEKGFDELVPSDAYDVNGEFVNFTTKHAKYLAPTQSLLQKWLREEHDFHLDITYQGKQNTEKVPEYLVTSNKLSIGIFDEYEDALEVGLQETLKLI